MTGQMMEPSIGSRREVVSRKWLEVVINNELTFGQVEFEDFCGIIKRNPINH